MPTFLWQEDDETVRAHLNQAERNQVPRWQQSTTYKFEFHNGHNTGEPIYVRRNNTVGGKNLTKFDTLNHDTGVMVNDNKLTVQQKSEVEAILRDSWAQLKLFAHRYHNSILAPPEPQLTQGGAPSCPKRGCSGKGRATSNGHVCTKCGKRF
jgi:hypothetical protein